MGKEFTFVVPGEPKGKGRPIFSKRGNHVNVRTPPATKDYEEKVAWCFYEQCGTYEYEKDVPLSMDVTAYFAIPKSVTKAKRSQMLSCDLKVTKRPDFDNILKIIADGLNMIAYHDDSQLTNVSFRKLYSDNPRVIVTLKEDNYKE
jgi:Holliday junction resolvase RusA-like endonuclease